MVGMKFIFQLTTSRRGRRHSENIILWRIYFNSLPHAEVDSCEHIAAAAVNVFQLTTSRRGRQFLVMLSFGLMPFQLTTSRRGRL